MQLTFEELRMLVKSACEAGVANYIKANQPMQDWISLSKAYTMYGKKWVEHHRNRGDLTTKRLSAKINSKVLVSIAEMKQLRLAEDIMIHTPTYL